MFRCKSSKRSKSVLRSIVGAAMVAAVVGFSCSDDDGDNKDDSGIIEDDVPQLSETEADMWEVLQDRFNYADGVTIALPSGGGGEDGIVMTGGVENTFVGYGLNVFKGPTFLQALGSPLLSGDVYSDMEFHRGNSYINVATFNNVTSFSTVTESLSEAYSNLEISVAVRTGASVPFFSGGFKSQFGLESELKSEARFYNSYYYAETRTHTLHADYTQPDELRELIRPASLRNINNSNVTPEWIFENMGTHIIVRNSIGGHMNMTGLYNSSEYSSKMEVSAALDFKTNWVEGEASMSLSQREKEIATNTSLQIVAAGGDVGSIGGATLATMNDALNNWSQTIVGNETLAKIYTLIPIWELASDAARKQELENYFYDNAHRINLELMNHFSEGADVSEPLIINNGVYKIIHHHSDRLLDGGGTGGNADFVHVHNPANNNWQQWTAVEPDAHKGYFKFVNMQNTNWVLTVLPNSISVAIRDWAADDRQLWQVVENGDGTVRFHSKAWTIDDRRLESQGTANYSRVYLSRDYPITDARGKWRLERVR